MRADPQLTDQMLLERIVDRRGAKWTLAALSAIATAKSDHVATNWQDSTLAAKWQRLATRLDRFRVEI